MSRTHPLFADHVYIGDLSLRRQKALRIFIERFRKGATEHADIETTRKWTKDMLEETVDKTFYAIFELMEMDDVGL